MKTQQKNHLFWSAAMLIMAVLLLFAVLSPALFRLDGYYEALEQMGLYIQGGSVYAMPQAEEAGVPGFLIRLFAFGGDGGVNLTAMAGFYALWILGAAAFFCGAVLRKRYPLMDAAALLAFVLIFADMAYLLYIRSLFALPWAMAALLSAAAAYLWIGRKGRLRLVAVFAYLIFLLLFAMVSRSAAICAAVLSLLPVSCLPLTKELWKKLLLCVLSLCCASASVAVHMNMRDAGEKMALYNSVFFGVAKVDSVAALGLDPALDQYREVFADEELLAEIEESFFAKVDRGDVIRYYFTHPAKLFTITHEAAKNVNFYLTDAEKNGAVGTTLYSNLRLRFFPAGLPVSAALLLLCIVMSLVLCRKADAARRTLLLGAAALALCGLVMLFAPVLRSGIFLIAGEYTQYRLVTDLLIYAALIGGGHILLDRREGIKQKYGVTQ